MMVSHRDLVDVVSPYPVIHVRTAIQSIREGTNPRRASAAGVLRGARADRHGSRGAYPRRRRGVRRGGAPSPSGGSPTDDLELPAFRCVACSTRAATDRRGRRAHRVRRLRPRGSAQRGPRPASTKRSNSRPTNPSRRPASTRFHASKASMRATSAPSTTHCAPPTGRMTSPRSAPTARSRSRWRRAKAAADVSVRRCTSTSGARSAVRIFRFRSATSSAAESTPRRRLTSRSSSRHPSAHRASRGRLRERRGPRGSRGRARRARRAGCEGRRGRVAPPISDADAFEVVDEAVDRVEEDVGFEIRFGLDMAAAELYDDDRRRLRLRRGDEVDRRADRLRRRPRRRVRLAYVEDPLDENDYDGVRGADRPGRRPDDDLRRRPVRHQRERAAPGRDRHGRAANSILIKAEPDRDAVGHVRRYRTRRSQRVRDDHFPPLGRDGGHDHRTPRRGDRCRVHQDRHGRRRAHRQAERTGPHRGRRGMTGLHHA